MAMRQNRSSNRTCNQAWNRRGTEQEAAAVSELLGRGNLGNECRRQRDVRPGEETEECSKQDICHISGSWDPERQDQDTADVTDYEEHIVSSNLVTQKPGRESPKETEGYLVNIHERKTRITYLAALNMETRYCDRETDMLSAMADGTKKLMGT